MADFYKTLLSLKKNNAALRAGDSAVHTTLLSTTDTKHVLAFQRKNGNSEVVVLLNFSKENVHGEINGKETLGTYTNVFTKEQQDFSSLRLFNLPAWGYLAFEKK